MPARLKSYLLLTFNHLRHLALTVPCISETTSLCQDNKQFSPPFLSIHQVTGLKMHPCHLLRSDKAYCFSAEERAKTAPSPSAGLLTLIKLSLYPCLSRYSDTTMPGELWEPADINKPAESCKMPKPLFRASPFHLKPTTENNSLPKDAPVWMLDVPTVHGKGVVYYQHAKNRILWGEGGWQSLFLSKLGLLTPVIEVTIVHTRSRDV